MPYPWHAPPYGGYRERYPYYGPPGSPPPYCHPAGGPPAYGDVGAPPAYPYPDGRPWRGSHPGGPWREPPWGEDERFQAVAEEAYWRGFQASLQSDRAPPPPPPRSPHVGTTNSEADEKRPKDEEEEEEEEDDDEESADDGEEELKEDDDPPTAPTVMPRFLKETGARSGPEPSNTSTAEPDVAAGEGSADQIEPQKQGVGRYPSASGPPTPNTHPNPNHPFSSPHDLDLAWPPGPPRPMYREGPGVAFPDPYSMEMAGYPPPPYTRYPMRAPPYFGDPYHPAAFPPHPHPDMMRWGYQGPTGPSGHSGHLGQYRNNHHSYQHDNRTKAPRPSKATREKCKALVAAALEAVNNRTDQDRSTLHQLASQSDYMRSLLRAELEKDRRG